MDHRRFDDLATHLAHGLSRRQGLGLLAALGVGAGLLAEDAEAGKRKKHKKHKKGKGKGNKPVPCTPESQATTCARGCGTQTNNCNQLVTCSCPTLGDSCLPNGTCARACTLPGTQCEDLGCGPERSVCGAASAEGPRYCVDYFGNCATLQSCGPQASTSNCPQGFACLANCGLDGPRCYPVSVCPPAP